MRCTIFCVVTSQKRMEPSSEPFTTKGFCALCVKKEPNSQYLEFVCPRYTFSAFPVS